MLGYGILLGTAALAQDNSLDAVIRAAEAQRGQLQSAEVTMTVRSTQSEEFIRQNESKNPQRDKTQTMQWAFKGEKLFREYEDIFEPAQQKNVRQKLLSDKTTDLFDGKDGYSLHSSKHTGTDAMTVEGNVDRLRRNFFSPLDLGYKVDTHWLAETLKARGFRYIDSSEDTAFGTLLHFADEEQSGKRSNVWIAPKFGSLAVRSRMDIAVSDRKQALLFETKQIEHKGNVWFPTQGSMKSLETKDGSDVLLTEQIITVTKWEVNTVPDSKFVPNIPVGAYMRDGETRVAWRVGANGERIYRDTKGVRDGSGFLPPWFSSFGIATLLIITILAYVRWKRRQSVQTV